jgi:hypothetical protein
VNFLDIVEAVVDFPGERPRVRRVIRRSGHRTLRICFDETSPLEERVPLLTGLRRMGATFEGASRSYFAIDVDPDGDFAGVRARVAEWTQIGIAHWEPGEPQAERPFDGRTTSR